MQVQVARWGNSLGLRIPKDIARQAGLREGARIDVEAQGDRIIISPARPRYVLADLSEPISIPGSVASKAADAPAGCLTGRFLPRHGVRDRLPDYLPRSSFWHVGTSVVLPIGLPVSGEILTNHVHSIDTLARPIG